ncbi:Hint domain-containing protein [Tabrizicola sp.]|uniref:Hint domain-containing protein n=1 Tax=Tabrizicola sp. TaxID=2005166 RepID=UPI00261D1C7F|nr:Hint domain-containing protein [Tabrizicola sp.]MDM7930857.1 Hint domain-containing protein [Tabrizicola sp.]
MATITGSNSANTITGDQNFAGENDSISAGGGADTVFGLGGNDTINGDGGADSLYGGDGDDRLFGGSQNDGLFGGDGNDTLTGGTGNDTLDGGVGTDTADFTGSTSALTVNLVNGTASGDGTDVLVSIENVIGGSGNDTLTGDSGANYLAGAGGNDRLFGGDGNDTLSGGLGNDSLDGGAGTDTADFTGATGNLNINLAGGTATGEGTDTLVSIENAIGGSGNDTLTGDSGANYLAGAGGNDRLFGGDGNDTLSGGLGNDSLDGGAGTDTADFTGATGNLNINLAGGTATGEGTDTLVSIENAIGGSGNDTISGTDDANILSGAAGNDSIVSGEGADTVFGGMGNDTIDGGADDDVLTGGPDSGERVATALDFNWITPATPDNTNLAGGFTQDTGGINVAVTYAPGVANVFRAEDDNPLYVEPGEPFNTNSAGYLSRPGAGTPTEVNFDFSSVAGSGYGSEVENVQFRISDIDRSSWTDRIIVRAYDANGNLVPVNFIEYSSEISVTGDTILATGNDTSSNLFDGSVLIQIPGPVASIEIIYDNVGTSQQFIVVSDIHFEAISVVDDDSIIGGAGNDTIYGGIGQDTLIGGADNDVLYGGAGNDSISGGSGDDTIEGGAGIDLLFGGDGNDVFIIRQADVGDTVSAEFISGGGPLGGPFENDYDTIDLSEFDWAKVVVTYDLLTDPTGETGTISIYADDAKTILLSVIEFTEIEKVIPCFTPGTMIMTDRGEVAVETLVPGDLVLTRDHGLQPLCWVGKRQLSHLDLVANPDLQPVRIGRGAFDGTGPDRSMLVSPQHRLLIEGATAELLFGEAEVLVAAKHLLGRPEVTRALPADGVCYIHILFDRHEIVQSDGIWTESFQPAERMLSAMEAAVRAEVVALFPEMATSANSYASARLSLKAHEARVLLAG